MKKLLLVLISLTLVLCMTACGGNTDGAKTTEIKGNGYGGEIVLNLTTKGEEIVDLEVVSDHETAPVFERAFPIIRERILAAQSPVIDNVSGATFSSYAVKKAVADEMKAQGKDFGEITMTTEPTHEKATLEDATADLVIVGGGPAGLAAAITAKENGVENVILVEKMDILSGNGKFDMNFFDMFNSKATRENGNAQTKEEFIASYEGYYDSIERLQRWADVGFELDDWFRTMGIELNFNYGGTSHMAEADEYAGNVIQTGLEKAAKEKGVDIRTATKGTGLIMTDGAITGVSVETRDGNYNINAKAVVIATGGFCSNPELLAKYAPGHEDGPTSNQMSTTGDFIPVFEELGMKLDHMSTMSVFTNILVPRRDLTGGADAYVRVDADGNEKGKSYDHAFFITDKGGYDSFYRIRKHVDAGYYTTADTLEELASKLGVNYDNLLKTIEEYNATWTPEGYRALSTAEGPFYGVKVQSANHMTKGGVVANENAQVINNNNEIVKGLYAAGEVTATDGCYNAAVVFGRVAGIETAKFILGE